MRKDISVIHMKSTTGIDSENNLLTFDAKAGESMKPIVCLSIFWLPEDFLADILQYKIVTLLKDSLMGYCKKGVSESCSFVLVPEFGYTNQILEDIFCNLFEKCNL